MRALRLGPKLGATLIYATLPVAYFFSFWHYATAQIIVAVASGLVLLGGLRGQAARILGFGLGLVLVLLLKDFWPLQSDWLLRFNAAAGFTNDRWWHPLRHPQIEVELRQAGTLATALLGVTAIHSAWASGLITLRTWLRLVAMLALTWVLSLLVFTDRTLPYGPGNCLPGVLSKNAAASLSALGMLLGLGLAADAWRSRHLRTLTGWFAGAMLAGWAVLTLNSWTAVLGALAGSTLLIMEISRSRRHPQISPLWIACSVAALLLVVLAFSPTLGSRVQAMVQDYRFAIWRDVLRMLAHNPLGGFGLGSFENVYPFFGQLEISADARLFHPDSSWVLLAVEWGLVPLMLLGLAAVTLRQTGNAAATAPAEALSRGTTMLGHTISAGALAWAVCGLTDPALHRPGTAFIGFSLLPFLVHPNAAQTRRPWQIAAVAAGLSLSAVGLWAGHRQERATTDREITPADLKADPLNSRLHWQLALQAWNQKQDRPRALAHFRAVALLEHRSMRTAETIARLLSPAEPGAALYFWQAAFQRGRTDPNRSAGLLQSVALEFPRLNAAYWEEAIIPAAPDLRLVLALRPDAESERLLRNWLAADGVERLHTAHDIVFFYRALGRVQPSSPLLAEALAQRPVGAPREFYLRAAQAFHQAKDEERAWAVLLQIEPWRTLSQSNPPALTGARSLQWLNLLTGATGSARARLLEEICEHKPVNLWFQLERARGRHASGQTREAVAQLLAITPDRLTAISNL